MTLAGGALALRGATPGAGAAPPASAGSLRASSTRASIASFVRRMLAPVAAYLVARSDTSELVHGACHVAET